MVVLFFRGDVAVMPWWFAVMPWWWCVMVMVLFPRHRRPPLYVWVVFPFQTGAVARILLMVFIFSRYVFVWPSFDEEEWWWWWWWYVFEVVVAATMMCVSGGVFSLRGCTWGCLGVVWIGGCGSGGETLCERELFQGV